MRRTKEKKVTWATNFWVEEAEAINAAIAASGMNKAEFIRWAVKKLEDDANSSNIVKKIVFIPKDLNDEAEALGIDISKVMCEALQAEIKRLKGRD